MTIKYYSEEEQKQKLLNGNPILILDYPCHTNDGIVKIKESREIELIELFEQSKKDKKIQFFIPASGSGSRMFQFLFEFLGDPNEENRSKAEKFINRIKEFAFYYKLPIEIRNRFEKEEIELDEFIEFILFDECLNFSNSPKGLIPFHKSGNFILNPFQEQILQGINIAGENVVFNFTIQKKHENRIKEALKTLGDITGKNPEIHFSEQDTNTDSVAFDMNETPAVDEEGNLIKRPSGHGALLSNLNKVDADFVLIKNIDNVQHIEKSAKAVDHFKLLSGVLVDAQSSIFEAIHFLNSGQREEGIHLINELNKSYQLFHSSLHFGNYSDEQLIELLHRPIRVCGMVVNEGQPGGGPYWVKNDDGLVSKQIVEKAQISKDKEQYYKMLKATHHNPVEIVCGIKDYKGEKFDLSEFSNDDLYFIVEKDQQGQKIRYIERPGLWNGSMDDWNTIFVEVSSKTFTPVKTILDLLEKGHRED
ncbi:MAG: DUF4301 family protein [Crocinitomicaceae bacterium]|nr:DUF4301 family protein [Crocinitomicaceae bacterium]